MLSSMHTAVYIMISPPTAVLFNTFNNKQTSHPTQVSPFGASGYPIIKLKSFAHRDMHSDFYWYLLRLDY